MRSRAGRKEKKETDNPKHPVATEAASSYDGGWHILLFLALFRGLNALLIRTAHVPDEQWQSLEVAYHMVFKYPPLFPSLLFAILVWRLFTLTLSLTRGYLSWEWRKGIRGYTHPLIFAFLYKLLSLVGWDSPWMIVSSL